MDWKASPGLAFAIRAFAFVAPLVAAFLAVRVVAEMLWRPAGTIGLVVWVLQAAVVGAAVSKVADLQTRQLLPLATLFGVSLVFPDQAPSRFGVALRTGTVKQLQSRLEDVRANGLGATEAEACETAVELVAALGKHDRLTRGHTERVRAYADLIGEELELNESDRQRLAWGVLLHDVGKLFVPSEILNKPGKPTDAEWEVLKAHPAKGGELLKPLAGWLGPWALAASQHHERWDGTGYPAGLSGNQISLAGRITSVADAYDVITSKRSYKAPLTAEEARKELVECAGTQFDPAIVRAFLNAGLGRRWTAGPIAWLADLPIGQIGSVATSNSAVVVLGSTAALGSAVVMPAIDHAEPAPAPLAFTVEEEVASAVTTTIETPTSTVVVSLDDAPSSTTIDTTTTIAPSTTTSAAPTTTVPFQAPTTTEAGAATTTTAAPTTSTTTSTIPPSTTTTTIAGGHRFNGHTYVEGTPGLTWTQAVAEAAASGGHLVTIGSQAENDFVNATFGGDRPLWLGLTDSAAEGTFVWITGEPLSFTNWMPGEPNDFFGQDQAAFGASTGEWNDTATHSPPWWNGVVWDFSPPPAITVIEFDF